MSFWYNMTVLIGLVAFAALVSSGTVQAQVTNPITTTVSCTDQGIFVSATVTATNQDTKRYESVFVRVNLIDANNNVLASQPGGTTNLEIGKSDTIVIPPIRYSGSYSDCTVEITSSIPPISNVQPQPDTTAPVITLIGQATVSVTQGTTYTDSGATCVDETDGSINPTLSGTVDTNTPGTYTLTYTCADVSGNNAIQVDRTVTVNAQQQQQPQPQPDTTAPVITLIGQTAVSVTQGTTYTDSGATCVDETDGSINPTLSGTVDTNTPGTYTLTYTCADVSGNNAIQVDRTVIVNAQQQQPQPQPDTTAPVITLIGQATVSVTQGTTYTDSGATCVDETDGSINPTISGTVDTNTPGTYTLTYTCADVSGNNAIQVDRTVIVNAQQPTTPAGTMKTACR